MKYDHLVPKGPCIKDLFGQAIKDGIDRVTREIMNRAKKQFEAEFEAKAKELIAGLSVRLFEHIDMEHLKNKLVITIRTPEEDGGCECPMNDEVM